MRSFLFQRLKLFFILLKILTYLEFRPLAKQQILEVKETRHQEIFPRSNENHTSCQYFRPAKMMLITYMMYVVLFPFLVLRIFHVAILKSEVKRKIDVHIFYYKLQQIIHVVFMVRNSAAVGKLL